MEFESGNFLPLFNIKLSNSVKLLENKINPAFIGGFVYLGCGVWAKREIIFLAVPRLLTLNQLHLLLF